MSRRLQIIQLADCEFGRVEYRPGGSYGPAVQNGYQLIVLNEGYADLLSAGKSHRIDSGFCRLLPKDQTFRIRFGPHVPSLHSWSLLSENYIAKHSLNGLLLEETVAVSHQMNLLIEAALEQEQVDFENHESYFARLAECVFREYIRLTSVSNRTATKGRIDKALDCMHRRIQEPLSVASIASEVGMSRQHFSKVFNEELGQPVAQYLWELRVKKAHALLLGTGLSLSEIALHTGFQNPFHLSRRIKAFYGHAPSEIRKGL